MLWLVEDFMQHVGVDTGRKQRAFGQSAWHGCTVRHAASYMSCLSLEPTFSMNSLVGYGCVAAAAGT